MDDLEQQDKAPAPIVKQAKTLGGGIGPEKEKLALDTVVSLS